MQSRALPQSRHARWVAWLLRLAIVPVWLACGGGGDPSSPVTPTPVPVASITLSSASALIDVAGTVQLTAVARNAAGAALTGRSIAWASSAPSVATVSSDGLVTGLSAGAASISASSDGQSAAASITVQPRLGAPATMAVQAGNTQQAASGSAVTIAPSVIVRDRSGVAVAGVSVQFSVSAGGGTIVGASPTTDAAGIARVTSWTLGTSGTQRLSAVVGALPAVVFDATVIPATIPTEGLIGLSGGTVIISTAGHPWEGTTLTVPPNTFATSSTWRLRTGSASNVPALPTGITVQGLPLLIETAQLRGDRQMTLRVPIEAKAGKQVLLALYDPIRGAIEIMPTVSRTATSVTVLTGHLHPSLLLGPNPPVSSNNPFTGFRAVGQIEGVSTLLKLEALLTPLLEVNAVSSVQDLWPAPDRANEGFLSGHGNAIPAMNTMLRTLNTSISGVLKAIGPVGFLADTASFGTLEIVARKLSTAMQAPLQALRDAAQDLPKPELDQIVTSHLSANLAVTGRPAPVGLFESRNLVATKVAYATAIASSANAIQVNVASDRSNIALVSSPQGIAATAVKAAAQASAFDATVVMPMTSFQTPYELILPDLQRMVQGLTGSASVRQSVNQAIAGLAGLPAASVEHQATPDGPWTTVRDTLVFRKAFGKLRAVIGGVTQLLMVADPATYTETLRSATPIDISQLPSFAAAPERSATSALGSILKGIGQTLEQVIPLTLAYVKEPFVVTPETTKISDANRRADFAASVGRPPAEGFRIKWEWGDNTPPTENLGLTTATHTYTDIDKHTVVATLIRNDVARTVLAVDTVQVETEGVPFWRITSIADPDSLLDEETLSGSSPLYTLIQRIFAVPASAIIALENEGGGKSVLRLRVLPAATWTTTNCCPPLLAPFPGELRQTIGEMPAITYSVGPFFGGYNVTQWSQSTADLSVGTLNGTYIDGGLLPRKIKNAGVQLGPRDYIRIQATRNGTSMTGTISIIAWFQDEETEEVDPSEPTIYRLPFTAVRVK